MEITTSLQGNIGQFQFHWLNKPFVLHVGTYSQTY